MRPRHLPTAALALAALLGCSDSSLELTKPKGVGAVDDQLEIQGHFCTQTPANQAFPVRVLFLIDLSNSMCYTDPASGSCTAAACTSPSSPNFVGSGIKPRRELAVEDVIRANTVSGQMQTANPGVAFAVITFSSVVKKYPLKGTFTQTVADLGLDTLRNVDSVTDYQGALSTAYNLLDQDMSTLPRDQRPRTKYAVVFLTDGEPFPHCSRAFPDTNNPPNCARNPGYLGCDYCISNQGQTLPPGFQLGMDYNEDYQIQNLTDGMHKLADAYGVGELKIHAVQLFVPNAAVCCPDCFLSDPDGSTARRLLTRMARESEGLGSFTWYNQANAVSFAGYDFTSLKKDFVPRTLLAVPLNAQPAKGGRIVDSDGDGLSDDFELHVLGTDRTKADTDGDGYSDLFEYRMRQAGNNFFDPKDPQKPGLTRCRDVGAKTCPLSRGPLCDTDGDGLKDCEEAELGTLPDFADTDMDGIPDGVELRYGSNPLVVDTQVDADFDGVPNLEEISTGFFADRPERFDRSGQTILYDLVPKGADAQGRNCYDFNIRGLQMLTTLERPNGGSPGFNDFMVWVGEGPRGDARDYGRWRVGCVRGHFVAPNLRVPAGPSFFLDESTLRLPQSFDPAVHCLGAPLQ